MICCSAGPLTLAVVVLVALPCGFPSACSYVLVKRSVSGGRQKCCGLSAWLVGLCALHGCFQGNEKWRRSSEAIEPLWASCCCSPSLLWLPGHSGKKMAQQSLLVAGTLPFLLLAATLLFLLLGSHGLCCKPQQWGSSYGKGSASSSRRGRWNQQESDKTVSLFSG